MNEDLATKGGISAPAAVSPLKIFLSYRRDDSSGDARLLYDRLAQRFGPENVFLDVVNLQPGVNWLREIDTHSATCAAFLVLIGARWETSIVERTRAAAGGTPDIVRREIEFALDRKSGVSVLPVLIDDAVLPPSEQLPRPIRQLAALQAVPLRHSVFDQDIAHLIDVLNQMAASRPTSPPPPPSPPAMPSEASGTPTTAPSPGPDDRHYRRVLQHLVDENSLVILLGPRVNADPYDARRRGGERGRPPDAEELAVELARRFRLSATEDDLACVAQQVFVTSGMPDLYRTLRQLQPAEPEPVAVHKFLAALPTEIERLVGSKRCQLIVTTNYDLALERAFDAEQEPYDLAVYMASGDDAGKFVHFPFDGEPEVVTVPNGYDKFPIDEYGELTRTVILKIHGAVDGSVGEYRWRQNYVITEDQYIDYLSRGAVESLVPVQILDKLTGSHWLFLGYTMRDWALRVFLNRIWRGRPLEARSWAVEEDPDMLEKDYWSHVGVEMMSCSLVDYLSGLAEHLSAYDSRAS